MTDRRCQIPCYQINNVTIEFRTKHRNLLEEALKSLGLKYSISSDGRVTIQTPTGVITIAGDKVTIPDRADLQAWVNKIKQAYGLKVVEMVAKRHKINVTAKQDGTFKLWRYA